MSLLVHFHSFGQNPKNEVVTSDIQLFWTSYDLLSTAKDKEDSIRILREKYIEKISDGLTAYFRYTDKNNNRDIAEKYMNLLNRYSIYYKSIRNSTIDQANNIKKIENVIKKYKSIYSVLIVPKITLGIGFFGTPGLRFDDSSNVFIGTEYYYTESANFNEFGEKPWYLNPKSTIPETTIHEITHSNLKNTDSTLLYSSLGEGAGVFMTSLIAGEKALTGPGGIPKTLLDYITQNKDNLFEDFEKDLNKIYGDKTAMKWFYGDEALKYPKLLYYGLGYFIHKAYYDKALDKTKAIKEIITLKNYKTIWAESHIGQK